MTPNFPPEIKLLDIERLPAQNGVIQKWQEKNRAGNLLSGFRSADMPCYDGFVR
jgi:hypothetical protein